MPLEGIDAQGRHIGVIADILKLIAERTGLTFQLLPTDSWQQSLARFQAGDCDLLTAEVALGPPPPGTRRTHPYLRLRNVYVTRLEAPFELDFALLAGRSVGIPRDYPTIAPIRQAYPEVELIEVASVAEGLLKVSRGELHAFTGVLPVVSLAIQRQGLSNLKVAGHLDLEFPAAMAVRADLPLLSGILDKAVATIAPRTLNDFMARWLPVRYDMRWQWIKLAPYVVLALVLLGLALYWNRRLHRLNQMLDRANGELARRGETDPLTGAMNRNHLRERAPLLVALARRTGLSLAVAMFDLDHFKGVNDSHGHAVGDQCLKRFADCLASHFGRATDLVVRYGGEEFAVICVDMTPRQMRHSLEAVRREVEALEVPGADGQTVRFTVSVGFAVYPRTPDTWDEDLLSPADRLLYLAKSGGRNRVEGKMIEAPAESTGRPAPHPL
ncbi:diguanylate cyclase (GGDEF) domain-containing protein [Roseospirillum parvum]|uniref:diguanylate cyclase n=2 Tax=Roseospirillum parvum TaxID=83401 RepID=A0A1G8D2E7_9PROT|nr:diguanylate cyclase (GGDEF) domain-containing protein [Roseospirillum parvum]